MIKHIKRASSNIFLRAIFLRFYSTFITADYKYSNYDNLIRRTQVILRKTILFTVYSSIRMQEAMMNLFWLFGDSYLSSTLFLTMKSSGALSKRHYCKYLGIPFSSLSESSESKSDCCYQSPHSIRIFRKFKSRCLINLAVSRDHSLSRPK